MPSSASVRKWTRGWGTDGRTYLGRPKRHKRDQTSILAFPVRLTSNYCSCAKRHTTTAGKRIRT